MVAKKKRPAKKDASNYVAYLLLPYLLPLAAGGFIYVAASDLIPELHCQHDWQQQVGQGLAMVGGVASMHLIVFVEDYLNTVMIWP